MGVERLRSLFRICNVSGLLPFRMVFDAQTKRFKRFERGWCWFHPLNWWFLMLFSGQGMFYISSGYVSWTLFEEIRSKSTVYFTIVIFSILNYILMCLSLRLFLFRFRHLETALEILDKIDRLTNKIIHQVRCHSQRHTIFGIAASLITVICNTKLLFVFFTNHFTGRLLV